MVNVDVYKSTKIHYRRQKRRETDCYFSLRYTIGIMSAGLCALVEVYRIFCHTEKL